MVTAEALAARKEALESSPDLQGLLAHLAERNEPVVRRLPPIPSVKALLSVDGGVCPDDGATLQFDPWSPDQHRCPACGKAFSGERHHRNWARFQHLWLAERAVELATLDALAGGDQPEAGARALEILGIYGERYFRFPNQDNVLGPSRLFFSTYLESIWVLNYLAAAAVLREAGRLDEATGRAVHIVAEEAANLIGEFDEGFSNRQTWNNAALTAIAVWFEDEELARRAIEGRTGLIQHLRGYRSDGMWFEGENYHLFALRGLLLGAQWAAQAGVEFFADPDIASRVARALRAPIVTALPDLTFPARKDSRFGVSLTQPMYAELWEVGQGDLGTGKGEEGSAFAGWLSALYDGPPVQRAVFESYLHDAPVPPPPSPVSRTELSWWALWHMQPSLTEGDAEGIAQTSGALLPDQGLAVLRSGDRYASLECGPYGGGHGHPDRLHLTLHAAGVHWLPDPGTGSYVSPSLPWYRSTLAHNAPRLDGVSQTPGDAVCEAFEQEGEWGWMRGRFGALTRTVVLGPDYLLDLVELSGRDDHTVELPWHLAGRVEARDPAGGGRWEAAELNDPFVSHVERFVPGGPEHGPRSMVLESGAPGGDLAVWMLLPGSLLRAEGPGLPEESDRRSFFLQQARGRNLRFITVIEFGSGSVVQGIETRGDAIEVRTKSGTDRHQQSDRGWTVVVGGTTRVTLGGMLSPAPAEEVLFDLEPAGRPTGQAFRLDAPPPLDGTTAGFDGESVLHLDTEDQYRRSEEPYEGPEDFRAEAYVGWDDAALYLAVDVTKEDLCIRSPDAPPLRLDNEPDAIHSDGIQVYLAPEHVPGAASAGGWPVAGYLILPDKDGRGLRVATVSDGSGGATPAVVRGSWRPTDHGYCVTVAIPWPVDVAAHGDRAIAFDLIVNEMVPGRERRAGQLVWSGRGGWVWLRGDRQDAERLGVLELIG